MGSALAKWFYAQTKLILLEPLGTTVHVGSVGYFDAGQWVEVGTTQSMFRLPLSTSSVKARPNIFDGKSGKGLKFTARAKGEVSDLVPKLAHAHARAEIAFGSKDAFVASVKNQTVQSARELAALFSAIRFAYRHRQHFEEGERWEKKYAVIVGVASAASVAALSASMRDAHAVVVGAAPTLGPTTPAELDGSMKLTYVSQSVDQLWLKRPSGYAVQALRIKPSVFRTWDRQDLVFVQPRELSFTGKSTRRKPKRPKSYVSWAQSEDLDVGSSCVEYLTQRDLSARRARKV